jgi:hypothetical protein
MKHHQLKASERILKKLKDKHQVRIEEVWECFMNRGGGFLEDTRVNNRTEHLPCGLSLKQIVED